MVDFINWINTELKRAPWSELETVSTIGKNSNGEVVYNHSGDDTVYYAYNGNGNPIKEVVQDGLTALYTYDSQGNILLQTISDGTVSRSTRNFYDNSGRVLRKIGHEEYDETKYDVEINEYDGLESLDLIPILDVELMTEMSAEDLAAYLDEKGIKHNYGR